MTPLTFQSLLQSLVVALVPTSPSHHCFISGIPNVLIDADPHLQKMAASPKLVAQSFLRKRVQVPIRMAVLFVCWVLTFGAQAAVCPKTFEAFFLRFGADREFQQLHIHYPLVHISRGDNNCYPDCPTSTSRMTALDVRSLEEPIYPLEVTRTDMQLVQTSRTRGKTTTVHLEKPESDSYLVDFRFARAGECWKLVHVFDRGM